MRQVQIAVLTGMLVATIGLTAGCARQTVAPKEASAPASEQQKPKQLSADPSWFACNVDTDCKVVEGLCKSQTAVNVKFTDLFFEYRDKMNPTLECAVNADSLPPANAACFRQRCALQVEGDYNEGS